MERQAYEQVYRIEEQMWWYRGRRALCMALLERFLPVRTGLRVLDVGCGTGYNLDLLRRFGEPRGVDFAPDAIQYCHKRGIPDVVRADATDLPFPAESFDLVTAFDVIEHIEDDGAALREIKRVLVPQGHLLIYTPALPILYGEHDRIVHHQRRYMKQELEDRIREQGLELRHLAYSNLLVLPLVLLARLALSLLPRRPHAEMSVPPEPFNATLSWLCRAEVPLVLRGMLPVGMSLVALCQKETGVRRTED